MFNLGVGRVRNHDSDNIFKKDKSLYKFVEFCEGKKYDELNDICSSYYETDNTGYFGQIITPINLFGLITLDNNKILVKNDLLEKVGKNIYDVNTYMNYFLCNWQFPNPTTKREYGRNRRIIKPYVLLIKLLDNIHKIDPLQAYLTEKEFIQLFLDENNEPLDEKIINFDYCKKFVDNRKINNNYKIDQENNSLNYIKSLLKESFLLDFDKDHFNNPNNFYVGLDYSESNKYIIRFIINSYIHRCFTINVDDSFNNKEIINDYGIYINNENRFRSFEKSINLIKYIIGFKDFCAKHGYYYEEDLIRRFVMSLETKRFLLITGISGTGKTKIAELWVKYLNCGKDRSIRISVGSNWNDNKKLLGFKNILFSDDNYEKTNLVNLLERANSNKKEYIVILDEMNLSYVERYFADFLSALESFDNVIDLPDGTTVKWSDNVKVIGTVNVDETTYMFSPKVLDRANVIEMNGVKPSKYIDSVINSKEIYSSIKDNPWFEEYKEMLDALYDATNKGFAYRTVDEMTKYISKNMALFAESEADWKKYMDEQIFQKVLPKLHGNRSEMEPILNKIMDCIYDSAEYPLSSEKINTMKQNSMKGYISFIGD